MEKNQPSPLPREMPAPLKEPEIKENDLPETIIPPNEEPLIIPPEAPDMPTPGEMPAPEKQNAAATLSASGYRQVFSWPST